MSSNLTRLAIVIPAFKGKYLDDCLRAFAGQTDQSFTLYVGDDASPEDLKSIVACYEDRMSIVYHRFDNNLGGVSLVKQWERCVNLSAEPWVWLFSDDDVASPDCVEAFYRTETSTAGLFDVYRIDTEYIDADGRWLRSPALLPSTSSSLELIYHRVVNGALSIMPEHIFSREAYEREGGFVDFPLAWCSDHASLMQLARKSGIHVIPGPRIKIRTSGLNISSRKDQGATKAEAILAFVKWFANKTDQSGFFNVCTGHEEAMIQAVWQHFPKWFYNRLYHDGFPLHNRNAVLALSARITEVLGRRAEEFVKLLTPYLQESGKKDEIRLGKRLLRCFLGKGA